MRLELRSQAEQDLAEAIDFYLSEESPLAASRFLEAVDASIDAILKSPRRYRSAPNGVREKILDSFPYSIAYICENDMVVVLAIRHHRRLPSV